MHRVQELLRLYRLGQGTRGIARQLRMGRDTMRCYMRALGTAGLLEGSPEDLPELDQLRAVIGEQVETKQAPQQRSSIERWSWKVVELREKGAGPTAIFDWLRLNEPDFDGSLSAIKRQCKRIDRERGPSPEDVEIPVETAPGKVAQVDFGYAGKRYDPRLGVLRKCWLFVMTLGHSRHMHCELAFDQKIETWVRWHVEAFQFFGGVPRVIVPDNLKAAVVRAAFGVSGEPVLNRTYVEIARHYGFQIDPTPPRAPQKKGKVERGVRYVKGNFLKTHESVDIDVDRRALRRWLLEIAGQRRHGTTGRAPIEHYEAEEGTALLPLPASPFELVTWKKVRLHRDSHAQIDGAFYSAPWTLLGKELWARCTKHTIALYHEDRLQSTHSRSPRGSRSTIDSHLPEHRRDLRHRSREYWEQKAQSIGDEVLALVSAIFDSDDVLYQLRKVQAIVTHLGTFPPERARAAARRALHFGCLDYAGIKNILRKGLDLEQLPQDETRAWSKGSRFARKPTETLLAFLEKTHGDRR